MKAAFRPGREGLFQDTVWNAAVNAAAAGLSALLLLLASHLAGAYWCGVVALGLAVSQQLYPLGNFTMGSYQASDVAEKCSFGDYVAAKSSTVGAMLLVGAVWLAVGGFGRDKALAGSALLLYQASDSWTNVFFSRYQQKGRLDLACKIRFAKIMAFAVTFAVVLWMTRDPVPALWAGSAVHAGLFFALDAPRIRSYGPLEWRWPGRAAWAVLVACAPLAANSFLSMYVSNGPRFAVDSLMGEETLAAYGALFMVSFAVAICGDFLMNPQLVRLARAVEQHNRAGAWGIVRRQACVVGGLGAVGLAAGAVAGIPVLSWLFGLNLEGLRNLLLVLLGGGVLLAFYQLGQEVLVVVRRQAWGTPGMILAAGGVFLAARPAVGRWGLAGAAWCYFGAVALLAACSGIAAFVFLHGALSPGKETT